VDLSGKDVRRAVPKGLPYFAVDFGLDSGFAHVIEVEKMFSKNFAQVCLKYHYFRIESLLYRVKLGSAVLTLKMYFRD
jgi:hypothetical protein